MAIVGDPSSAIGQAICDALGIDIKHIRGIEIRLYAGEAATVHVEYYPHTELEAVVPILKHYKLEPIDD